MSVNSFLNAFWRRHFAASFGEVQTNFQSCGALMRTSFKMTTNHNVDKSVLPTTIPLNNTMSKQLELGG